VTVRVDQYVHTFRARDAVSDEARLFRDHLRERGFAASIFAVDAEPAVAAEVEPFDPRHAPRADAVIYHHATVADVGAHLARWKGRKALLYHGVTPPDLVRPYDPLLAEILDGGRQALSAIAPAFGLRFADSRFGADELHALTGQSAEALPFSLDARRFPPTNAARAPRGRRGARWLSVGRIAPNKGLCALVRSFAAYVSREPEATLTLAGAYSPVEPYYWAVREEIDAAGLFGKVELTGSIDDAALAALYVGSDAYVCTSEHEGFCVPLVEAMLFDLPIVAVAAGAIPETLGGAGILVPNADPFLVSRSVADALADDASVNRILAGQRYRLASLRPDVSLAAFDAAVHRLLTC
jgi:glycosyltransferase involved in cell wall biosynthesis